MQIDFLVVRIKLEAISEITTFATVNRGKKTFSKHCSDDLPMWEKLYAESGKYGVKEQRSYPIYPCH